MAACDKAATRSAPARAELDGHGVDAVGAVEVEVEDRVHHVEAADPQADGEEEEPGLGRQACR